MTRRTTRIAITSVSTRNGSPAPATWGSPCCAGASRPNSCGQHWIADLGIEGKKVKVDGAVVDAYYFCVGGAVGRHQAVARPIGLRLPATAVAPAIERLLRAFQADRRPSENFRQFAARHTDDELRRLLASELVEAVARDAAADRPPHGVDG